MATVQASSKDFEEIVLKSPIPVLVDFWAAWCGPCRAMAPVLEEISKEMEGKIKIVKVNIEEPGNEEFGTRYEIRSIPNMKLFKNGTPVKEFVGSRPKETLLKELRGSL